MKSPQPSRNKSDIDLPLRRMGMSLSVLGAVAVSAGLAACGWKSGDAPGAGAVLLLATGIIMLITGVFIWYFARKAR